jgi:hypothetical protein
MKRTFTIGIGGAAGQGVATPGDIFAKIFSRRGLHLNAYNAYQSIIRGGHTFLTIRTGPEKVTNITSGSSPTGLRVFITLRPSSQALPRRAQRSARFRSQSWPTSLGTRWPRTRSQSALVSA